MVPAARHGRAAARRRERPSIPRARGEESRPVSAAQQAVADAASSLVSQGVDSLTNIQAKLGSTQSAVTDANSSMSSQLTILQQQLGNLDEVNANTTAVQINSLTNQIQMAYELTSRLQQLNLAQYLPIS
jgi:flagellar hook-associated protein 3 FlgL